MDIIKEIEKEEEEVQNLVKDWPIEKLDYFIQHLINKDRIEQLKLTSVVSSFLDNLKDSDSRTLLEMKERNQNEFIKWCTKNPHAGVDDEWENELMFMRDVAKYCESIEV